MKKKNVLYYFVKLVCIKTLSDVNERSTLDIMIMMEYFISQLYSGYNFELEVI